MRIFYLFAFFLFIAAACTNLGDAKLEERNTFMHFYEGGNSLVAAGAAQTADGFVIAGTIAITGEAPGSKIIVIKTDVYGQKVWQKVIEGGSATSLRVTENGYIIIGDSIQYNPTSENIPELVNNWSRLITMDIQGNITADRSFAVKLKTASDTSHVDFHGDAVTFDNTGNLITLGSRKVPGGFEFSYVAKLTPALDTLWYKNFNYINRDYVNANAVHYNRAGNVLWASSILADVTAFSRAYLSIPVIKENGSFVNSDFYGETSELSYSIRDIQPSPLGYSVIGTFSQPDGKAANVFFIQADHEGNFNPQTARYMDGLESQDNVSLSSSTSSSTEDTGDALTYTRDGGYILAGSITTTPQIGSGGKDIWLIKLDGAGNMLWNKLIGASTDETVSSIHETSDGGLLICGTKTLGGLSSIFLIKTDSQGELKN
jgi:hypothetical protein